MLHETFLPDRDNTFAAFDYTPDGKVFPKAALSASDAQIAADTLALTGLDKPLSEVLDSNGEIVAIDRVGQRMEAWIKAQDSLAQLSSCPTNTVRRLIAALAVESGYFSVWMKVFEGDVATRALLITSFRGTEAACFDAQTQPRTPRPQNGLAHCGKI
ncbi:MAG: hypothetical protein ABJE95_38545 [Byssovorax sp.]